MENESWKLQVMVHAYFTQLDSIHCYSFIVLHRYRLLVPYIIILTISSLPQLPSVYLAWPPGEEIILHCWSPHTTNKLIIPGIVQAFTLLSRVLFLCSCRAAVLSKYNLQQIYDWTRRLFPKRAIPGTFKIENFCSIAVAAN